MRPALLYGDMQSIVGFSAIPKCVTLNDLVSLFRFKFCFRAGLASCERATSENNCAKTIKDRHTLSARQSLAGILVSANIRFMRILGRVL